MYMSLGLPVELHAACTTDASALSQMSDYGTGTYASQAGRALIVAVSMSLGNGA